MKKYTLVMIMILLFCSSLLFSATFDEEKTKTADGENFLFPADALRTGPAVFALTMGKDRDNGEVQQMQVIGWQEHFDNNPTLLGTIPVYHFSVLSGVPFFVKGTIRGALHKFYADKTDPSRVAVLFVSKTDKFAQQAGFPADESGTIVVVASDGSVAGYVKGEVTSAKVAQLQKVLATL
ncbi:MAG: hypothetical protein RBR15_14020 [Sphaerochaeta sp.]|nr:hypothetical protein [Sphaerochaeta sp.]